MELVRITKESGIPLIGCIAFGIIDRGTNLLQVRPTTVCNLKCEFCSVNANNPEVHPANFTVDVNYLLEEIEKVVKFKGVECEINIDSAGEVGTYPQLIELVRGVKGMAGVKRISMQTNGTLLDGEKVFLLQKAGLSQINLSINSLNPEQAQQLSRTPNYSLEHILGLTKIISDSGIQLLIAPVWIPKINDDEMPKLIELAKKLNAKIGIQKYEAYRHSRKVKGAKPVTFWKFYHKLKEMEQQYGIGLICTAEAFGVHKAKRLPTVFEENEKVQLVVKTPGWLNGQMIAVGKDRCVSINDCRAELGKRVRAKILENKNNIYVAEMAR
ncbi:MAG TPA: radical SAM protein [Nanoarchaeota archaeon]|nr:radical SAM protein [Nanoarchaeota archaeon]